MAGACCKSLCRAAGLIALSSFIGAGCRPEPEPPVDLGNSAFEGQASFALIVETKEQMGCQVDQRALENVGPELRRGIAFGGGTAGEDSEKRVDLYLGFDATGPARPSGWLVFRIWVEPDAPGSKAQAILTRPSVDWSPIGWSLNLRASGKGVLRLAAGWLRSTDLQRIWRSCPEADIRDVFEGHFLAFAPFDVPLKPYDQTPLKEDAKSVQVHFDKAGLTRIAEIAAAMEALDALAAKFGSAESKWLWREDKLSREALKSGLGKTQSPLQAIVRPDSGASIATNEPEFAPALRFRLALLTKAGQKVGAEVSIGPLSSTATQSESGS